MTVPRTRETDAAGAGGTAAFDLSHLEHQTLGDRALRAEVLALFAAQLATVHARLAAAGDEERRMIAHTLKGSARAVGAFAIAASAERIEAQPGDARVLEALRPLIGTALAAIASIGRGGGGCG